MFSDVKSLFLVLTVAAAMASAATSTYIRTGKCKEKTCIYKYTISGGIHDKRAREEASLSAQVTLRCESVGTFNEEDAVYYCIDLADVIQTSYEIKIDQDTKKEMPKKIKGSSNITSMMSNRFCFARDSNGKLLSVFHSSNETNQVINMKKTIASSFQANFDKTTEETESDTQSVHKAHYSYKSKGKNTVEHRSVSNNDVVKYSGNAKKKGVDYKSDEDVEIDEDNVIVQSSGTSITSLSRKDKSEEKPQKNDQDIPPIEVKSRYTMKKVECLPTTTMMSLDDNDDEDDYANKWDDEPVAAALIAEIDERELELDEMEDLNSQLQDLSEIVKRAVRRDTSFTQQNLIDESILKWKQILHLESKHGAPSDRKSKLDTIFDNLKKVSSDDFSHNIHVRLIIYDLLSSEGSLAAQQALLSALKLMQRRDQEYDSIVLAITLLHSVNRSTLLDFKEYMMNNMNVDEELLLSFATLGRHKNVEQEVVNTITQLIDEKGANDTDSLIYFIHALGNTGSKLIIPHLIPYLVDNNKDIQLTAIDALRTVSTDKEVQKKFTGLIASDTEYIDVILAIIDSLKFPYESFLYYPEPPEEPEDEEVEKKLLMSIVNATVHFHDDALYNATVECLKAITSNDFTTQLMNELVKRYAKQTRDKRSYSSYWANSNSLYNHIASYYSRSCDSRRYPYNKALLWAKTLGPSKVHAILAAGGFAGVGSSGYKVYGKGVFKVYCFGRTYTAVDAEYNGRRSVYSSRPTVRKYVKVLGRVYSPRTTAATAAGYSRTWRKNFYRIRLFRFTTSIYIKVGTLSFTVSGTTSLDASLNLQLQAMQANAALTVRPSITITGNAEINLLLIWKIGVDVTGNMGYYIMPKAIATLCDTAPRADASSCFGIFHGSKGLRVNVRGYYRRRTCSWYRGCSWTAKRTVNAVSTSRTYRRISQQMLWGRCSACSCSGALNRFCRYVRRGRPSGGASNCSCRTVRYQ